MYFRLFLYILKRKPRAEAQGAKKNKASHSGLVGVEELISMTDDRSPLHA